VTLNMLIVVEVHFDPTFAPSKWMFGGEINIP
jgi:hypothetical protein